MSTAYDFTPLWRSTIGFDRLLDLVDTAQQNSADENYPLCNVERLGEDRYQISLALAGFSPDEIVIAAEPGVLTVEGRKAEKPQRESCQSCGRETRRRSTVERLFGSRRSPANEVDLDQRVVGETGDPDASAGRQATFRKITAIDRVHGCVVLLETREINPRHHDIFKTEIEPGQHQPEILHHRTGLRLDRIRQFAGRIGRIRHLSGDEDKTVGFDGMAEWRYRFRSACDHVEFQRKRLG
jgi:HSP20 family molecular chaperone IbpA